MAKEDLKKKEENFRKAFGKEEIKRWKRKAGTRHFISIVGEKDGTEKEERKGGGVRRR